MTHTQCSSRDISTEDTRKAANLLWKAFLSGDNKVYGPIDKLGLATSPESLLTALFEIERGLRALLPSEQLGDEADSFFKIMSSIATDAKKGGDCLEEAIKLAHEIAVKTLAKLK